MEKTIVTRQAAIRQKRGAFDRLLTWIIIIGFIVGCVIALIASQRTMREKKVELAELQAAINEVKTDNVELERILGSPDIHAYMEKQAIEELNYAYPNEHRYYDISRD